MLLKHETESSCSCHLFLKVCSSKKIISFFYIFCSDVLPRSDIFKLKLYKIRFITNVFMFLHFAVLFVFTSLYLYSLFFFVFVFLRMFAVYVYVSLYHYLLHYLCQSFVCSCCDMLLTFRFFVFLLNK